MERPTEPEHIQDERGQQAGDRFQQAFASLSSGFCIVEAIYGSHGSVSDLRIVEANPAMARLMGVADAVGRSVRELDPEAAGEWIAQAEAVVRSGQPVRTAYWSHALASWFSVAISRIQDVKEARLSLLFTEAANPNRTTESLLDSEKRYRDLVRLAPTAIFEIDLRDNRFLSVNDALCDMLGYSREELLALNPFLMLDEESRARMRNRVARWLSGGNPGQNVEYKIKAKDGRVLDVVLSVTLTCDEAGRPFGAAVIAHDITERKQLEDALIRKELLLRTVIQSTSDILFIKDRDSRVVFINEAYGRLFKIDTAGIIGMDDFEIYGDRAVASQIRENDRQVMETGVGETFEEMVHTADGTLYFQFNKMPWRDERGEIIGIVGSGMDITARKNLEIQLRRQAEDLATTDRNKNQFLNMLSHELRNPLAAIVMGIDLLAHTVVHQESVDRTIRVLKRQSGHLARLVDDLLDVTRITANKIQLKKEPVELVALVQRAVADYQFQFEERGIASVFAATGGPIELMADPVRLTQAIGNLVHNAIKYARRGDQVTVRVDRTGGGHEATIQVIDNGSGIEPDLLPHLFEPFSQADRSLARSQGGLGLGLSIVKGMVELHGGSIEATSEGTGKGSTFVVRLPVDFRP